MPAIAESPQASDSVQKHSKHVDQPREIAMATSRTPLAECAAEIFGPDSSLSREGVIAAFKADMKILSEQVADTLYELPTAKPKEMRGHGIDYVGWIESHFTDWEDSREEFRVILTSHEVLHSKSGVAITLNRLLTYVLSLDSLDDVDIDILDFRVIQLFGSWDQQFVDSQERKRADGHYSGSWDIDAYLRSLAETYFAFTYLLSFSVRLLTAQGFLLDAWDALWGALPWSPNTKYLNKRARGDIPAFFENQRYSLQILIPDGLNSLDFLRRNQLKLIRPGQVQLIRLALEDMMKEQQWNLMVIAEDYDARQQNNYEALAEYNRRRLGEGFIHFTGAKFLQFLVGLRSESVESRILRHLTEFPNAKVPEYRTPVLSKRPALLPFACCSLGNKPAEPAEPLASKASRDAEWGFILENLPQNPDELSSEDWLIRESRRIPSPIPTNCKLESANTFLPATSFYLPHVSECLFGEKWSDLMNLQPHRPSLPQTPPETPSESETPKNARGWPYFRVVDDPFHGEKWYPINDDRFQMSEFILLSKATIEADNSDSEIPKYPPGYRPRHTNPSRNNIPKRSVPPPTPLERGATFENMVNGETDNPITAHSPGATWSIKGPKVPKPRPPSNDANAFRDDIWPSPAWRRGFTVLGGPVIGNGMMMFDICERSRVQEWLDLDLMSKYGGAPRQFGDCLIVSLPETILLEDCISGLSCFIAALSSQQHLLCVVVIIEGDDKLLGSAFGSARLSCGIKNIEPPLTNSSRSDIQHQLNSLEHPDIPLLRVNTAIDTCESQSRNAPESIDVEKPVAQSRDAENPSTTRRLSPLAECAQEMFGPDPLLSRDEVIATVKEQLRTLSRLIADELKLHDDDVRRLRWPTTFPGVAANSRYTFWTRLRSRDALQSLPTTVRVNLIHIITYFLSINSLDDVDESILDWNLVCTLVIVDSSRCRDRDLGRYIYRPPNRELVGRAASCHTDGYSLDSFVQKLMHFSYGLQFSISILIAQEVLPDYYSGGPRPLNRYRWPWTDAGSMESSRELIGLYFYDYCDLSKQALGIRYSNSGPTTSLENSSFLERKNKGLVRPSLVKLIQLALEDQMKQLQWHLLMVPEGVHVCPRDTHNASTEFSQRRLGGGHGPYYSHSWSSESFLRFLLKVRSESVESRILRYINEG
ncbi:hypothetical protein BJ508DRAFT_309443 [Ascobolus immersus RN42]|uniref:Uncharacterized protein n=1 Tax=Ascobolus immersus RN42 TaxID=1160509 RepID=A0A3N4HYM0_ASCIM|nr:hypothetical protein BJ508DRAFT_309443 [Ascobolus immersus RN42]